jgi:tetratricopeptide (TPR) repeat protein
LGAAYALAGRVAEALPLLDQMRECVVTGGHTLSQSFVLAELSEAYLLVGHVDEASTLARLLLELSRTHTGRGYQAHAYRLLGDVAIRREPPDIDQTTAHYRQALALADELGIRPLLAHCHYGLGILYNRIGCPEQARAELSAAIELYHAMEMTFWLERAEAVLTAI